MVLASVSDRKILVMVAVTLFAYTVVPKGEGGNGDAPMRSPRMMMQRQLASAPESSSGYCGMFPAWTNVVTNVCAPVFMHDQRRDLLQGEGDHGRGGLSA